MKKSLNKSLRTFFGISNFGYQILVNIETAFFSIFLTDTVRFPVAVAGAVMMLSSVADFILAPLSGAFISGSKAMKWGRVRSWFLVLPPLIVLFFLIQFSNLGNSLLSAVIITLAYVIGHVFCNVALTSTIAIIPEIAPNNRERLLLNSRRMMYNNMGRMASSYLTPLLLVYFTAYYGNENTAYIVLICGASVLMCASFWSDFRMTRGYEGQSPENAEERNGLKIKEIVQAFAHNPPLFAIIIADLSSNVGSFLLPALAVYYYKYVAQDMSILKYHLFFVALGGLLGAYSSGYLFRRMYKKKALLYIYFIITALLILNRVFILHVYIFIALQMCMQFFVGMSQPLEGDLYMDTAVYHEWKSGKNAAAFIIGLGNISVKLSIILKSVILTTTLLAIDYVADAQPTAEVVRGIMNAYIVPAFIPMIGAVSLGFFFKLNPEKLEAMQNEIEERKHMLV